MHKSLIYVVWFAEMFCVSWIFFFGIIQWNGVFLNWIYCTICGLIVEFFFLSEWGFGVVIQKGLGTRPGVLLCSDISASWNFKLIFFFKFSFPVWILLGTQCSEPRSNWLPSLLGKKKINNDWAPDIPAPHQSRGSKNVLFKTVEFKNKLWIFI